MVTDIQLVSRAKYWEIVRKRTAAALRMTRERRTLLLASCNNRQEFTMGTKPDPVAAIFRRYGITDPWRPLRSTGIANRIYATRDVVLRVATDHREAVCDARTESVAAPVAYAAGIMTPRLLAFDDSRELVDRPFSLWERVNGETLGLLETEPGSMPNPWREAGRQLALLHCRISCCPDPKGYLDRHGRNLDPTALLRETVDARRLDAATAKEVEALIEELRPQVQEPTGRCFLHGDMHAMNVMCTREGTLLAIIDWGDAGWGDPTLDLASVPLAAIPFVVDGYESEASGQLGETRGARIIWDKIDSSMYHLRYRPSQPLPLDSFRAFLRSGLRMDL
jgi:Ser/Thr protein kinase RdoA (MazF antagonist)